MKKPGMVATGNLKETSFQIQERMEEKRNQKSNAFHVKDFWIFWCTVHRYVNYRIFFNLFYMIFNMISWTICYIIRYNITENTNSI